MTLYQNGDKIPVSFNEEPNFTQRNQAISPLGNYHEQHINKNFQAQMVPIPTKIVPGAAQFASIDSSSQQVRVSPVRAE